MSAQDDFMAYYGPLSQDIAKQTGLDPSVVLGIIAHESGNGQHIVGNNPFGLSPGGKVASYPDTATAGQAFVDLMNSPKFAGIGTKFPNPDDQAAAISAAGYGPSGSDAANNPQNASGTNYGATIAARARTFRIAGLGAPSADDLLSTIAPAARDAQPPPAATGTDAAAGNGTAVQPLQAPSGDDLLNMLTADKAQATPTPVTAPAKPVSPGAEPDLLAIQSQVGGPGITPTVQTTGPAMAQRLVDSAVSGYYNTPPLLAPGAQSYVENKMGPLGSQLYGPAIRLANGALGVAGGLGSLVGTGIPYEVGNAIGGPQLGRDAVMLGQSAGAVAGAESATAPRIGPTVDAAAAQTAADRAAAPLPQSFTGNPVAAGAEGKMPTGPIATPEVPPGPTPLGASGTPAYFTGAGDQAALKAQNGTTAATVPEESTVGAMQNHEEIPNPTKDERITNETKQLNQTAIDRAQPGPNGSLVDTTEYVPGVQRTLGGQEFNPINARDEKVLSATDPKFAADLQAKKDANNGVRTDAFTTETGDQNSIARLNQTREDNKQANLYGPDGAFVNKTDVDAQPIVDHIDSILNSSAGKQQAVSTALQQVRQSLYDKAGNLETNPEIIYGARQNLTNMLGKSAQAETPTLRLAASQLNEVKGTMDSTIESGAPGYQKYLSDYQRDSAPINQQEYLQQYNQVGKSGSVYDTAGQMQFAPFQRMMSNIVRDRAQGGANPAMSITPETMDKLWSIRNDLAADNWKSRLAAQPGSDTMANFADANRLNPIKQAATDAFVHKVLAPTTLGAGNLIYQFGYKPYKANQAAAQMAKVASDRKAAILNPSVGEAE